MRKIEENEENNENSVFELNFGNFENFVVPRGGTRVYVKNNEILVPKK